MRRLTLAASVSSALLAIALPARDARACAAAPPRGQEVVIAAEEALIVWDAPRRTEHFVRRAQFESTAVDFGFLVPTPTPPTLAEVDGAVFARLEEATQPRVREERPIEPQWSCLTMFMRGGTKGAAVATAVRVLSIQSVAGYEAAVLQADDAKALRGWLDAHGYDARPSLVDWLAPYVAAKWTVTAFKIADAKGDAGALRTPASAAVRMTFTADAPFYPYREPAESQRATPGRERALRVFYASADGRAEGAIGGPGRAGQAWPGALRYAAARADLATLFGAAIPAGALPATAWLHDFVDASSPRPGVDDVYFARAQAQAELLPPPIVVERPRRVWVPIDLIVLGAALAWLAVRLGRRAA